MHATPTAAAILALATLGTLPSSATQDPQKPAANRFVIEAGEQSIRDLIDRAAGKTWR